VWLATSTLNLVAFLLRSISWIIFSLHTRVQSIGVMWMLKPDQKL
jgi:hypothetical protein